MDYIVEKNAVLNVLGIEQDELVQKIKSYDFEVLEVLRHNQYFKNYFIVKDNLLICKHNELITMLESREYLENSYTTFSNKIGLRNSNGFASRAGEVVLTWPYKDCVLQGGQTKEEQKKNEVFYNEIIARDEIDEMFSPKILHNFKKYDENGEYIPESVSDNDNFLIKGNNLIALYTLIETYSDKIKLIYIDPPYNTKNDSFNYNDTFNHSTWLTFMKNRLEVAKKLLSNDGVIMVSCDDNEQAYLKVLMDDIFRNNFVGEFIRKTKSVTNDKMTGFNMQHEYCLVYAKDINQIEFVGEEKDMKNYKNPDNDPNGEWISDNPSAPSGSVFEIINPYTGKIDLPPTGREWQFSKSTFEKYVSSGKIKFKKTHKENERGFIFKRYKNELRSQNHLVQSLEFCQNNYMNQVATKEIQSEELFGEKVFKYAKPESFIERLIAYSTKPKDIVLDFHLGSGTTAAVAHKMGRRYIGIEQMDYIQGVAKERLKKVILGEQGGISKAVNWSGGGSFVYCELLEENQIYIKKVSNAKTVPEIYHLFSEMKDNYAFKYTINLDDLEQIIEENKESEDKVITTLKTLLIAAIDKNQLYLPFSRIEDKSIDIDEKNKKLNLCWYKDDKYYGNSSV